MNNLSHARHIPVFMAYLGITFGCRTAEFKSIPKERTVDEAPEPGDEEINAEPKKPSDPTPVEVPASSPIVETGAESVTVDLNKPRETVSEKFVQEEFKAVADILIVVDDSNSMVQEQKNLSTRMNALIQSLKGTDWQIGVVTTSPAGANDPEKCKIKLIKSADADAGEKFLKAVQPGVNGSGTEEGIRQAVEGLKCENSKWVRESSTLAVLIVSDEDNCSNGQGCKSSPARTEQFLIDYVEKSLGRMVGVNAGFYGIYSPPSNPCASAANTAHIYHKLIHYRGQGKQNFGRICDSSYESTLQRISKNIATLLRKTFDLKEVPLEGSLKIEGKKPNGEAITKDDYDITEKVLAFRLGREPIPNSEFTVTYEVLKN